VTEFRYHLWRLQACIGVVPMSSASYARPRTAREQHQELASFSTDSARAFLKPGHELEAAMGAQSNDVPAAQHGSSRSHRGHVPQLFIVHRARLANF